MSSPAAQGFDDKSERRASLKRKSTSSQNGQTGKHLPVVGHVPNRLRNHVVAMTGEFVGTFLFLFFAFAGTQVANASAAGQQDNTQNAQASITQVPNASVLLYISLAFGFSLAVNAWVFFRVSGGLFNPAVTLGLYLSGNLGPMRSTLIFVSQILGSIASAAVVDALFPGALNVSTTLGGGTTVVQGLFIEMFLTAELVITILMLAAEKHKATFLAPVGIGLALFIAELTGVFFTGGSLNPARSFGPCVALRLFPGYHWIYWLGPGLGAVIAAGFYRFLKVTEYETAAPGQDFDDHEDAAFEFDEDNAATAADVARPNVARLDTRSSTDSRPESLRDLEGQVSLPTAQAREELDIEGQSHVRPGR